MKRLKIVAMLSLVMLLMVFLCHGLAKAPETEDYLLSAADSSVQAEAPNETFNPDPMIAESPPGTREEGSANISGTVDTMVSVAIIPLIAIILGLIKKSWDKNRFTTILLKLWGLIKDCDNYFANPGTELKIRIETEGVHKAKKDWVIAEARKTLREPEISLVKKKAGGLGNAVELAITLFKYGGAAASSVGSLVKLFK